MQRAKPLLIILGVLLLGVGVALLLGRGGGGGFDPISDHSSLRTNYWGTKALTELCRASGLDTASFDKPPRLLSAREKYLCLLDPTYSLQASQLRDLLNWVQGGGTLLVAPQLRGPVARQTGGAGGEEYGEPDPTDADYGVLAALGLAPGRAAQAAGLPVFSPAPELRDVHLVYVPARSRLRPALPRDYRQLRSAMGDKRNLGSLVTAPLVPLKWETLLGAPEAAVLLKARHGAGRLYVLAEAQMLANGDLNRDDNVVLAANLLFVPGVDRIYFDEAVHLLAQSPLSEEARQLSYGRALPALLALMAALLVYLVCRGLRFGAPLPLRVPPRRSALEFVNAVADLYRRAGARGEVLALLRQSLRRRLAAASGTSPTLPPETLAAAVAARPSAGWTLPTAPLVDLLYQLEPREGQEPDERELLALARSVATYEEALAHGRRHH